MKIAKLKVVLSSWGPGLSLRGPKGKGHGDDIRPHITAAGFEPDEDVVLISAKDYEELVAKATCPF